MTKPSDVSQADWDRADEIWSVNASSNSTQGIAYIARALRAEREACAQVADAQAGAIRLGGRNAWHGANDIAAAIRRRNET